jgi:hypothetical protein
MPNKDIWVLPYRLSENAKGEKEKTQHSIVAGGNPCVWAGEVDTTYRELIDLRGDSGHFRTYGVGAQQNAIFQFALSAFEAHGYKTSGLLDNSKVGKRNQKRSNTDDTIMSSLSA